MPQRNDDDVQKYLSEAGSWETDRIEQIIESEKKAWKVAICSGVIALTACAAIFGLTPFKTVKTDVLLMDRSTGNVETLVTLKEAVSNLDEVFHKKFITDFMLARENYTYDTAEPNYYAAASFMSPQLQNAWGKYYELNNPASPLNVYKRISTVKIDIRSITLNTKDDGKQDVATIRFDKKIAVAESINITHWVATLTFKYVNPPVTEKEKRINPAGFQVTEYRVDPEIGGLPEPLSTVTKPPQQATANQGGGAQQ